MARVNVYIPKEDKPVYEKAKEYASGSISAVIVDQLKQYVAKKEEEATGMQEIRLLIGQEDYGTKESNLTGIKFIGRHLAVLSVEHYQDNDLASFNVYFTKKSKILVHEDYYVSVERVIKHNIFEKLNDFLAAGYPPELINAVLKNMPEIHFKDLDV